MRHMMASAALTVIFGLVASAEAANFTGETIEVIVPFGQGGATFVSAKFLEPYFEKHLPGNPQIDVRGPKGVPCIRPFFESGKFDITVYSDESAARFGQLCKNVEFRYPVMNLLSAAGVDMTVTWTQKPTADYQGSAS